MRDESGGSLVTSLGTVPGPTLEEEEADRPSERQRDFLLLTIFVLARHGYVQKAGLLAEALRALGDDSPELLLARAVLMFSVGEWKRALAVLDDLDRVAPIERFGTFSMTERQRMRRYLKARCQRELGDGDAARETIDAYLRHGESRNHDPG